MVSPGDPGVSLCHSRSCREVDGETPNTLGDCDRGGDREKVRSAWGSEVREPGEGKCQNRSAWPFCRASCIGPGPDGYEKLSEQGWQDRVGWGRGKAAHQDGGGRGWERGWGAAGGGGMAQGPVDLETDISNSRFGKWEYWEHGERELERELIGK